MLGETVPTSLAELSGAYKTGAAAAAQFSLDDVASHNNKADCWVVLHDRVLDVTDFLKDHPGGELAILTFAGKDATAEFDMIHPPDVIEKYLDPSATKGVVAGSAAAAAGGGGGAASGPGAPLLGKGKDDAKIWGHYPHETHNSLMDAIYHMVASFLRELLMTIFSTLPVQITGDRASVTRSAFFLFVFIIIHAVGNLHVFLGPDDFNGYGYFYVRLYWTGFGLDANIVEEYVALCAMLHVMVALKRTYDISIGMAMSSGKLNLAISGITLLGFMTLHLFQFRFGVTQPFAVCPPPYLVNLKLQTILDPAHPINLFWEPDCKFEDAVYVRDIYRLEFELFKSFGWCWFYISSVAIFCTHLCLGWQKLVPAPALDLPKRYHSKMIHIGYVMTLLIACVYISFPVYTHFNAMKPGNFGLEPPSA